MRTVKSLENLGDRLYLLGKLDDAATARAAAADLAAAREREGRLRAAMARIVGDCHVCNLPADAGRMPVNNKSRELAALVLGFGSAAEVDALREREGG